MTWNYRVVRREYPDATPGGNVRYAIHEAYYRRGAKRPYTITVRPVDIAAWLEDENPIAGLRWTLRMIARALKAPVLDYETHRPIGIRHTERDAMFAERYKQALAAAAPVAADHGPRGALKRKSSKARPARAGGRKRTPLRSRSRRGRAR